MTFPAQEFHRHNKTPSSIFWNRPPNGSVDPWTAALSRPAQLVLPAKPAAIFTNTNLHKGGWSADLAADHAIMRQRMAMRDSTRPRLSRSASGTWEGRMASARLAIQAGPMLRRWIFSMQPIAVADFAGHAMDTHKAGFVQKDWRSPFQSSRQRYAARDFGEYWISLQEPTPTAEIGSRDKRWANRHGTPLTYFGLLRALAAI